MHRALTGEVQGVGLTYNSAWCGAGQGRREGKSFSRKVKSVFLRRRLPSGNWVQKWRLRGDVIGPRHQNE